MKNVKAKWNALIGKLKKVNIFAKRKIFYIVPLVVILAMLIAGVCYQASDRYQYFANIGVDFQGGTLLSIEFEDAKANTTNFDANLAVIKQVAEENKIEIARDQSSGESTILVQYVNYAQEKGSEDASSMVDTNNAIKARLLEMSKNGQIDKIKDNGITFTTIGNTSSKNLIKTAAIAVAVALACMLIYIVIRFDFYSALATIVALLHDLIIMMSFTVIFYVEIGDSIVAALITIVAYSINNTIVVFDKIRSQIKPLKKSGTNIDIPGVINNAIFSTMTRTIYTTFTTLVVMVILVAMGVSSIQTFGLPIIFGLIAGFYSSVFIASPLWGDFKTIGEKAKAKRKNRQFKKKNA